MRILITSGPSYEPIDQVRRLTNFSTGELGTLLAEAFAAARHRVICFRGVASTFAAPLHPVEIIPFGTNEDLDLALKQTSACEEATIIFHAAALCDFRVAAVTDGNGTPLADRKISSSISALKLTLEPQPKILASLRRRFPSSLLVGWKYELEGNHADSIVRGRRQIEENLTDACVLNGRAYGSGFGFISRSGEQTHLPDKVALCRFLLEWAEGAPLAGNASGQESFHALSSFTSLSPFI